jgi:hypothetical protein
VAALFGVAASLSALRHHAIAASHFVGALDHVQGALSPNSRRHLLPCTVMDMPNKVLLQALVEHIAGICGDYD